MQRLWVLVIWLGLGFNGLLASDWPQFLGPHRNGVVSDTGIRNSWQGDLPRVVWKVALTDDGYAGPASADGMVFIVDHRDEDDVVRALTLAEAEEMWTYRYADPGRANYGYAKTTPLWDAGRLYTLSRQGLLLCLDARKGSLIWKRQIVEDFKGELPKWEISISPFLHGDQIIVCPGGEHNVVSLDKMTGNTVWTGGDDSGISYATPVLASLNGKQQLLLFAKRHLMGMDPKNGQVFWRFPWETRYDVNAAVPVAVDDQHVFISSGYKRGCALVDVKARPPKAVWENTEIQAHFNSTLLYEGMLFGNSDPDHLVCLDPKTGEARWKERGFQKGGLIIADGLIIALSGNRGELIMADATPDGYQERLRFTPLGGQSWTAPILVDGYVIVRNKEAMVCLDFRK